MGHRISARSVHCSSTIRVDGTDTRWHEVTWHLRGGAVKLMFDEELLQRHIDDIKRLLTALASAAREFAEDNLIDRCIQRWSCIC